MIPHDVEGDRGDAAGLRAKPLPRLFDFRKVVSQHVNPPMHIDAVNNLRRIVALRVAAHKVGHQIAGQRTVGEMGQCRWARKFIVTTSFKYFLAGRVSGVALRVALNGSPGARMACCLAARGPLPPVMHSAAAWRHSE